MNQVVGHDAQVSVGMGGEVVYVHVGRADGTGGELIQVGVGVNFLTEASHAGGLAWLLGIGVGSDYSDAGAEDSHVGGDIATQVGNSSRRGNLSWEWTASMATCKLRKTVCGWGWGLKDGCA